MALVLLQGPVLAL